MFNNDFEKNTSHSSKLCRQIASPRTRWSVHVRRLEENIQRNKKTHEKHSPSISLPPKSNSNQCQMSV